MQILLVSTYELGHQPLALAAAAAELRAAGHNVRCLDVSVDSPTPAAFADAGLIAFSVPMHTAARLAIVLARQVRGLRPEAHLCFFGLYATPLYDLLTSGGLTDTVIGGEYEPALRALADRLSAGGSLSRDGVPGSGPLPFLGRRSYAPPDRDGLPPLERYARLALGDDLRLAGYVEASRGCAHRCTHCPITPVYGGRLRLVQPDVVLGDVDSLVALGARHITFGDPDFFNAVPHSLAIVDRLRERHPAVTFDATIKVEHLVEHAALLPRLRDSGCLFITSAFESCNDEILRLLEKGHTRRDLEVAVGLCREADLAIRPTWVAFTPWGGLEDFVALLDFVEQQGLIGHVQPVQYALKLLVPPGSALETVLRQQGRLEGFDAGALTWRWSFRDDRLDALQAELAVIVEADAGCAHGAVAPPELGIFAVVKRAALRALAGRDGPVEVLPQPRGVVPGLTESWFC